MQVEQLVRTGIRTVTPYIPGKPIDEVQRERKLRRVIKLASNENALGPSKAAIKACRDGLRELHRYPDGSGYHLKRRLAAMHQVVPESVILGNGSDELFVIALRTFVNEGDEVIVAKPTFLIYEIAARIAHAHVITVPLTHELRYDLPAMRSAVTMRTKLIFIANPDNPTGTYVTEQEVAAFMLGMPPHVIVVFDEAYAEYVDALDFPATRKYIHAHYALVTRTFSKAHGLAGLRVGYGIAQPDLIAWMDRAREPFNVNSLAQRAALASLEDLEHVKRVTDVAREGKAYLSKQCERLGVKCLPSQTNFLLMEVGPSAGEVVERLLDRGVIVRDMHPWGLNRYIRVTAGVPRENKIFVKHLKRVLRKLK